MNKKKVFHKGMFDTCTHDMYKVFIMCFWIIVSADNQEYKQMRIIDRNCTHVKLLTEGLLASDSPWVLLLNSSKAISKLASISVAKAKTIVVHKEPAAVKSANFVITTDREKLSDDKESFDTELVFEYSRNYFEPLTFLLMTQLKQRSYISTSIKKEVCVISNGSDFFCQDSDCKCNKNISIYQYCNDHTIVTGHCYPNGSAIFEKPCSTNDTVRNTSFEETVPRVMVLLLGIWWFVMSYIYFIVFYEHTKAIWHFLTIGFGGALILIGGALLFVPESTISFQVMSTLIFLSGLTPFCAIARLYKNKRNQSSTESDADRQSTEAIGYNSEHSKYEAQPDNLASVEGQPTVKNDQIQPNFLMLFEKLNTFKYFSTPEKSEAKRFHARKKSDHHYDPKLSGFKPGILRKSQDKNQPWKVESREADSSGCPSSSVKFMSSTGKILTPEKSFRKFSDDFVSKTKQRFFRSAKKKPKKLSKTNSSSKKKKLSIEKHSKYKA